MMIAVKKKTRERSVATRITSHREALIVREIEERERERERERESC